MHKKRVLSAVVSTLVLVVLFAGPAGADPENKNAFGPIDLDCGDAGSYELVGHGNGRFAAAQVIDSTQVVVPLAFENATFTYTAPDGTVFGPELEPDATKGSGKQQGVWCDYTFDIDTGNGQENFSGSGDVKVKITPGN